jgi:hypothetical protein
MGQKVTRMSDKEKTFKYENNQSKKIIREFKDHLNNTLNNNENIFTNSYIIVGGFLILLCIFSFFSVKNSVEHKKINQINEKVLEASPEENNIISMLDVDFVDNNEVMDVNEEVSDLVDSTASDLIDSTGSDLEDSTGIDEYNTSVEENLETVPDTILEKNNVYGSEYNENSEITIEVKESSWIEIYDNEKQEVLFSAIFEKGDKIILPNNKDLIMNTGNAGGISVVFRGVELSPIGGINDVSGYISLNPKYLAKDRFKVENKNRKR